MKKSTKILIGVCVAVVLIGCVSLCTLCTNAGEFISNYLGHLTDYFSN